jgi:hypothetical protein
MRGPSQLWKRPRGIRSPSANNLERKSYTSGIVDGPPMFSRTIPWMLEMSRLWGEYGSRGRGWRGGMTEERTMLMSEGLKYGFGDE